MWHGEFRHPRLVEIYDAVCVWSREDEFFVSVVGQTPAARVLDLGCGTGRLTLALAAAGHAVTGVDPARPSLDAAQAKPGAERVTWLEGTARSLPTADFDVATMTAHVAQFFVADEDWRATLQDLCRCLVPGGRLIFDSRDPQAREWERWNPRHSRQTVGLADGSTVETWVDVTSVQDGTVTLDQHYEFADGEPLVSTARAALPRRRGARRRPDARGPRRRAHLRRVESRAGRFRRRRAARRRASATRPRSRADVGCALPDPHDTAPWAVLPRDHACVATGWPTPARVGRGFADQASEQGLRHRVRRAVAGSSPVVTSAFRPSDSRHDGASEYRSCWSGHSPSAVASTSVAC